MPAVDRLYRWLAQSADPGCDQMLGAALEHAEPTWLARMVTVLLERGSERSWTQLVGQYEKLPDDAKARLRAAPDRWEAAIAQAVRAPSPRVRENAVRAMESDPTTRLAYLLPELLHDAAPHVRDRAAAALREIAARAADPPRDGYLGEAHAADRRRAAAAVREALRRFETHHRLETIEAGLWYADELGADLWDVLSSQRLRAGAIADEQLEHWNSPRLAGFLLGALDRSGWRSKAAALLERWSSPGELAALLSAAALLDVEQIRQNVALIAEPKWFAGAGEGLAAIPLGLRPPAVRWVLAANLCDEQRLALLTNWIEQGDPELRAAAVFGLAQLTHVSVVAALRHAIHLRNPQAVFARWLLMAADGSLTRVAAAPASATGQPDPELAAELAALGRVCRRLPLAQREPLAALLRSNLDAWRAQVPLYLESPDPRDRLLVLQVAATPAAIGALREELDLFWAAPTEQLRRLAESLVRAYTLPLHPPTPAELIATTALRSNDGLAQPRRRLRGLLNQLDIEQSPLDPAAVAELRQVFAQVHAAPLDVGEVR